MITRTLTPITQSELAWMDQFHVLPTWVTGSRSREQYTTESPQQEPFLGAANTQSLEVMVQNLCVIQKKLLSENLTEHNTIELLLMVSDLQWKGGNSSSRLRQQQYAAQQFLQELGGWKIFYSHCQEQKTPPEHRYSSVPLFTKEEILQCQNVEARRFQVDFQGAQFLLGVFHAYSSFPRQKTLPSLTPASLFHELNKVELEAYFDLTAEMAKNLRSTSNIHINLSIPASVTSISPRRSNFFAQASRLSRKLKDHGAITYRDSESWLTHLDWSKTSPHWLTQSAGILGKVQKDYLNLCSKFFIYTFLKKHNPFIPLVRHRLAKSGELRLLQEGYIESIRLFLSNRYHSMLTFTLADQSVITGLELFWECVLAKKLCLPIPIGLQEIAATLKALEWDSAQTITKFCIT
ncbi:MAG: hypothetical protein OXT67_01265, partial [Zetaproteobacteria bacterium]|nr:hypothetical protein [Zetaproteobacteria bacterium]